MRSPQFRILSIDGGGIRGVVPCVILRYIEDKTGRPTADLFNLIAGTSTGGIIALGLTRHEGNFQNSYSAADLLELYVKNGKKIFSGKKKDLLTLVSDKLLGRPYDAANIEGILREYFGESKLKDALSHVLVTTYDIDKSKPFYFSSRLAKKEEREDFGITQVARSTSAAPTYFTPNIVQYEKGVELASVDGGVFANNPSILAYSEGKELYKQMLEKQTDSSSPIAKGFDPVVSADDNDLPFYQLSLGTGFTHTSFDPEKMKRNKDWIEPLLTSIFMRSVAESTHYTMQHLLPPFKDGTPRYDRLDFQIAAEIAEMDDASETNIAALIKATEKFVSENKAKLDAICKMLDQ